MYSQCALHEHELTRTRSNAPINHPQRDNQQAQVQQQFEAQQIKEELTQAEAEEIAVRKRRAEGTPCNKENFYAWKGKFEKEMEEKRLEEEEQAMNDRTNKKGKSKGGAGGGKASEDEARGGRLTGFEQFSSKLGLVNLDALEKAAEEAENEGAELDVDELDVDEDLFDEDEDLDDLDFDSDDDDEEGVDPDEEALDI